MVVVVVVVVTKCSYGYPVVGIMKLVVLHYSQLTVNDRSADKQSGVNLVLSSPAYPPPLSPTSGEREVSARQRQQTPVSS